MILGSFITQMVLLTFTKLDYLMGIMHSRMWIDLHDSIF